MVLGMVVGFPFGAGGDMLLGGDGDMMVMGLVIGFPLWRVVGDVMMMGLVVLAAGGVV